jgi:hypothetical protein
MSTSVGNASNSTPYASKKKSVDPNTLNHLHGPNADKLRAARQTPAETAAYKKTQTSNTVSK